MIDLTEPLKRISEITIEAGFQLARPVRYLAKYDCVRVDTIDGWYMEFDPDIFRYPTDIWEPVVRTETENLRKKIRKAK